MSNLMFSKYTDSETLEKIVDYKSVSEMWTHSVAQYPDNTAIIAEQEISYVQLDKLVSHFRTVLANKGIAKGDKIGVYAPNSVAFTKAFLAITTFGAVAVLLPPHLDKMTVLGCSMKFGLKAIVYFEDMKDNVSLVAEKNPSVILIDISSDSEKETPAIEVNGTEPCCVLFTGGTTGQSKGALLSNAAVLRGVKNGCYGYKNVFEQRYLLVLPLTHVFGLIRNFLTSLYTGSTLFICTNPKNMFKDIAVFRPTIMILVPALAEMALNLSKQFGRNMLGNDVKTIICGASTVAPYLVTEYDKLGIALLPGYGLTESANLVSGNPEALRKPDSVGLIYEGIDYKIVDGELWLKGINMMNGYVSEPEENASSYEDGWFKTGDLVRIDEEGFLYITGRKKEVIVLPSGENVSPAEIESYFYAIDAIQDCLVYEKNGSLVLEVLPRSAVLKSEGIVDTSAYINEKIREINEKLPSFERINKIIIRDTDFVRSPSMKIVRNQSK